MILDLGRTEAVLPASEQVRPEHYRVGQRLRVYVKEVYKASKGPQVVVSRANPQLIKRLFELEVPEVSRGAVEVMGIAREPGLPREGRRDLAPGRHRPDRRDASACAGRASRTSSTSSAASAST